MNDLIMRLEQTAGLYSLFEKGSAVIVALSGGADSVALLHSLYSIKEKYDLCLYAAHLNHGVRGEEADRDEQYCKILCEKYNIPFFVRRLNIPALAKSRKISEELCGRQERYAFFEELSAKYSAKTATAHTASDNAETLIFNLSRGTSVAGACGIPPKRGNIIRPLITVTRREIELYCLENNLAYVTDSTNNSDDYTRNQIRHHIIPLLKQLNPQLEDSFTRFTESAAKTSAYISARAKELLDESKTDYGYHAQILLNAAEAVRDAAVSELIGSSAERRHIELCEKILKTGGAVALPGGKTAVCKQGVFRVISKNIEKNLLEIPLTGEISFEFGDNIVYAFTDNSLSENKSAVFRTARSGDRFTYFRRNITKPLRKMFNEQKIPSEQRQNLLLLCDGSTVLWCEAVGFSKQGEDLRTQGLKITLTQKERTGENA